MTWEGIEGVRASAHPLDRAAAARDLWPGGTLDAWQGRTPVGPDLVVWPDSEAAVARVLERAAELGSPIIPYGAGSGVCGGARGRPGTVVLDLKRLDRIGPLDPEARTVEVDAGVNGQHLEDWLEARGFTLGHSPSSIWCSTVGGWAAARSAGQFSSRYGVFEDMVLGLRAVAPGRGAFSVGEGGDAPAELLPLLLGSEGTLAVITRLTLRVWPRPERRWLRGYRFPDVPSAVRAMRRLMQGELHPSVVRLYDPVDTRIGGKTRPKGAEKHEAFYAAWLEEVGDLPAVRRRTLSLPLSLPSLVNEVLDRMAAACLLVVGFEGDAEVVEASAAAGHAILCEEGEDLGAEPGERWYHSRHAVSYKLIPIFERGGFADTMEVAVRWSDLVRLYDTVRDALRPFAVVMAHMSHVYPEGGSIYFSFAGKGERKVYDRAWKAALGAVLSVGGTVTHHHGVGALKAEAASAEIGPAYAGFKAAKAELDPDGLLNPGRVFVPVPYQDPGPPPGLASEDGLVRVAADADLSRLDAVEAMWPWARLPGPPRWQRCPWQVGWVEVAAEVDGRRCRLGRGPRSAAGSDLRGWLARNADGAVTATVPIAPAGPRWMGEGRPDRPWHVARELLLGDLRPAVLAVVGGALRVGFRGPAAAALGAIAAARVPGGLTVVPWAPVGLPSGRLERCGEDDPGVVAVTLHGAWREAP